MEAIFCQVHDNKGGKRSVSACRIYTAYTVGFGLVQFLVYTTAMLSKDQCITLDKQIAAVSSYQTICAGKMTGDPAFIKSLCDAEVEQRRAARAVAAAEREAAKITLADVVTTIAAVSKECSDA